MDNVSTFALQTNTNGNNNVPPTIIEITSNSFSFAFVGNFLSLITTQDLPFEMLRTFIHTNLTFVDFAAQAIEYESSFIVIMVMFLILAFVPCISTCCWCCGKRPSIDDLERNTSRRESRARYESEQSSLECSKRTSVITLLIAFGLVIVSDLCIFYTNTRIENTIDLAPDMVKSTVHDIESFVKDTHLQIKYRLENGFSIAVEKVIKDLEDVDVLLGVPIQTEVAAHTGIELAFDSLTTLSLSNSELIYRVHLLQEAISRAMKISQEAAIRMEELQIQLSVLQRQCTYRDRPLCDTLRIRSFEENGIIDVLKTLQEDQTIFRLRYLGEIESGTTVKNLSSEVGISRSIFGNFPQQVKRDTGYQRNYTLEQLENIRHRTTSNAQMLTATVNSILERLQGVWDTLEPKYEDIREWTEVYRNVGWIVALLIIWVLFVVLLAYCCLLCEANTKAGSMFFIASIIICGCSIGIGLFGIASLIVGGNGEVYLCRPLYDKTHSHSISLKMTKYELLGKLLDRPGYLYAHDPPAGIIGELLRPDGVNRTYVNVSLASVLSGCEENRASYNVFQLDAFVNTTQISHLKNFSKVTNAIDAIAVSERSLLSLTQTIQYILENMLQISTFNLTQYRNSIGAPTPEKDLATFIDQMQRVALQIQDVATSSRMATLGSRSKRLQSSILQPLEQSQNEILYHLTALELQRNPWAKQVNQTLNHLRNIQEYLEATAHEICQNQTRLYTEKLKQLLTSSSTALSTQLGETTAKCLPFFDIFNANRIAICGNIVDNLNALWFFALLILLLWSVATPVGLNIISIQRKLYVLQVAQERINSSSPDRSTHSRSRSETREHSVSRQHRPMLKRTLTEETLDMDDDLDGTGQESDRQNRNRNVGRSQIMSTPTTPVRHQGHGGRATSASGGDNIQLRRSGTDAEIKWKARRMLSSRSASQPKQETKKQLQKQRTEEMDLEDNEVWYTNTSRGGGNAQEQQQQQQQQNTRINNKGRKQYVRTSDRESQEGQSRSITPILSSTADLQPATPMPRTPTRLRNRMSLTTRAVANIVKSSNQQQQPQKRQRQQQQQQHQQQRQQQHTAKSHNKTLQRTGTEEYDMDENEVYGESDLASNTLYNMRHTPPVTAPPPPPPPGPSHIFKRY